MLHLSLFRLIHDFFSVWMSQRHRQFGELARGSLGTAGPTNSPVSTDELKPTVHRSNVCSLTLLCVTGVSDEAWEELLVLPGDEALVRHLWGLGRRDAQIWARATGLEAAAAAKREEGKVYFMQG